MATARLSLSHQRVLPTYSTPLRQQVRRRASLVRVAASAENGTQELKDEGISYSHILVALMDSNPHLSSASRGALTTAASLATAHASKLTIMFVDEQGQEVDANRIRLVEGELQRRGLGEDRVKFLEEQVEPAAVGKGSVAVGEIADSVEADLLVVPTQAIHDKHVDGNLLAEFVSCPVLLLP